MIPDAAWITVGWIAPMPLELTPAVVLLEQRATKAIHGDDAQYHVGRIGNHWVAIAVCPRIGTHPAASVLANMRRSFPNIKHVLVVGIAGGMPSYGPNSKNQEQEQEQIVLGDVVVSYPRGSEGGVAHHESGAWEGIHLLSHSGHTLHPSSSLLTAVNLLRAAHMREPGTKIPQFLHELRSGLTKEEQPEFDDPGPDHDYLFPDNFPHPVHPDGEDMLCRGLCDFRQAKRRTDRGSKAKREKDLPRIHYGTIASANTLIISSAKRNDLYKQHGSICFEMEAAGIMSDYQALAIRGICDYADSHKNKQWQKYAAATAAAYAKELLLLVSPAVLPNPSSKDSGSYKTLFSLDGVPLSGKFVDRPSDTADLERFLLPNPSPRQTRKIFVLHGLGGVGKTQLAIDFARRHQTKFTSVFWVDGRSEDRLRTSLAGCATRIPGRSRDRAEARSKDDVDTAVAYIMDWLAQPGNTDWLLVFDNVDQDYQQGSGTGAYDLRRYLPGDHGSVLVTTRLSRLAQLGDSRKLVKADLVLGRAILERWYGGDIGPDCDQLFELLDGLPLALAQAASYLREKGIDVATYIDIYNKQWGELMSAHDNCGQPLSDYEQGSIATTWTVSFREIESRSSDASNLLRLWACLDNKGLWHGLLASAAAKNDSIFPAWVNEMGRNVVRFLEAIGLLLRYSMIEVQEGLKDTYSMHPVVHRWASYLDDNQQKNESARLALMIVGWSVPNKDERQYWILQQKLLPHAERCVQWIREVPKSVWHTSHTSVMGSVHDLGILYADQGKLMEAQDMYELALECTEKTLGCDHTRTLFIVSNLGCLYWKLDKPTEAEEMLNRALGGMTKAFGYHHVSTLITAGNLAELYSEQGRLKEAEQMSYHALRGFEKELGYDHISTLRTVHNLGVVYDKQGKLKESEKMFEQALAGREKVLGYDHISTLATVNSIGKLYMSQGKLKGAQEMFVRALSGFQTAFGPDHHTSSKVMANMEVLRRIQEVSKSPT